MSETTEKPILPNGQRVLRLTEVRAALGGVGNTTIFKIIKQGKLETRRLGGLTVVPVESLENYIASLPRT